MGWVFLFLSNNLRVFWQGIDSGSKFRRFCLSILWFCGFIGDGFLRFDALQRDLLVLREHRVENVRVRVREWRHISEKMQAVQRQGEVSLPPAQMLRETRTGIMTIIGASCGKCYGKGKVSAFRYAKELGGEAWKEVDGPTTVNCPVCKGRGIVQQDRGAGLAPGN